MHIAIYVLSNSHMEIEILKIKSASGYSTIFWQLQMGSRQPRETFHQDSAHPHERVCMRTPLMIALSTSFYAADGAFFI